MGPLGRHACLAISLLTTTSADVFAQENPFEGEIRFALPEPTSPAPAHPPPPPETVKEPHSVGPPMHWQWYGWQSLTSDLAAVGFISGGILNSSAKPAAAGFVVFATGGPSIHLLNDQPTNAGASALLRIALPLVCSGFAVAMSERDNEPVREGDLPTAWVPWVGMAYGMIAASALDALVISRKLVPRPPPAVKSPKVDAPEVEAPPPPVRKREPWTPRPMPFVSFGPDRASVLVIGVF